MVYKNTFHEKKMHGKKIYEKVAERIANVHFDLRENHLYQRNSKLQKCRNIGVLLMLLLLWNVGYISFIDTSVYAEQITLEEAASDQMTPEEASSEQIIPEEAASDQITPEEAASKQDNLGKSTFVSTPAQTPETLMIYMVGSNLESKNGSATADLEEILKSDFDTDLLNVLIYTGGTLQWHSDIPNDRNTIQQVVRTEQGLALTKVWENDKAISMGESAALSGFLNYCTENYTSEKYSLIFWDHGSGPVQGFGYDELFDGDQLSLEEMRMAFEESSFRDDQKLSWIGFDACLMASLEVAEALEPYGEYMIASQEVEPGNGWNYEFLSGIFGKEELIKEAELAEEPTASVTSSFRAAALGESMVDAYISYYHQQEQVPELTLACLDLQKIPKLQEATDDLFSEMAESLEKGEYQKLAKGRAALKNFGETSFGGAEQGPDLVDLHTLADSLKEFCPEKAQKVQDLIKETVVCRSEDVSEAKGLSVYYPYNNLNYYMSFGQNALQKQENPSAYARYISNFTAKLQHGGSAVEWLTDNEKLTENEYQLQLSEEQLEVFSSAYATIWMKDPSHPEMSYMPVVSKLALTPDRNGVLRVNLDQNYYVLIGEDEQEMPVRVLQTGKERRKKIFSTRNVIGHLDNLSAALQGSHIWVTVNFTTAVSGKNAEVQRIFETQDEENETNGGEERGILGSRMDVDLSRWSRVAVFFPGREPRYSENGTLLSLSEWESSGKVYSGDVLAGDTVGIEERRCADAKELAFYGHVEWKDVYGNVYAGGSLFSLNEEPGEIRREVTTKTKQGTLTWQIDLLNQQAALKEYNGSDEELLIPEAVEGYVVTEVDDYFINSECKNLKAITLPKTVKHIYAETFGGIYEGQLERIYLPWDIEFLEPGAFNGCDTLKEVFFVNEKGEHLQEGKYYRVFKNAILSKDGTSLLKYLPGNQVREYTIPEGVMQIEDSSFRGNDYLVKAVFPESLKVIGSSAFADCRYLQELILPESLESIGHKAFSKEYVGMIPDVMWKSVTVKIGKNVSFIGDGAFMYYPAEGYEVDEENVSYASKDGMLLNKAGDTLVSFPVGIQGTYELPEGITYLADGCLSGNSKVEELILPDSLQRVGEVYLPSSLKRVYIGAGLEEYPERWNYDSDQERIISPDNPYLKMGDGMIISGDGTTIYELFPKEGQEELVIPEGVTSVRKVNYGRETSVKRLVIPASFVEVEDLFDYYRDWNALEEILVSEENPEYCSRNGMMLSKDGKKLVKYPNGMEKIIIPETVKEIAPRAIQGTVKAREIVIPECVGIIRESNFSSYSVSWDEEAPIIDLWLPDSLREFSDKGTFGYNDATYRVHCSEGSLGEKMAREKGLEVEYGGEVPDVSGEAEKLQESENEELPTEETEDPREDELTEESEEQEQEKEEEEGQELEQNSDNEKSEEQVSEEAIEEPEQISEEVAEDSSASDSVDNSKDEKEDSDISETEYRLELTKEEQENFVKATMQIFCILPEQVGEKKPQYVPVVAKIPVSLDEEGALCVSLDQQYYVIQGEGGQEALVMAVYSGEDSGKKIFNTLNLAVGIGDEDSAASTPNMALDVEFTVASSDGKVEIQHILENKGEEAENVDLSVWGKASTFLAGYYGRTSGGKLKVNTKKPTGDYWRKGVSVKDTISIETRNCQDATNMAFYGRLIWTDTSENNYRTELFSLNEKPESAYETVALKTEKGIILCDLDQASHTAILYRYRGEDEELILPEKVGDYEVTKIDQDFFLLDHLVKKVTIPQTVKSLAFRTFDSYRGKTETIILPWDIEFLEPGIFRNCKYLKQVSFVDEQGKISDEGKYFYTSEGTVYSENGRTLFAHLQGKEILECSIPEGVERVESYAFYENELLKKVDFPETIREIGNAAFCGCTYLQGLEFPESLEKIGHRAFYKRWSSALMDYMGEDEIVKIGSHITFIGKGAFMEYSNLAFEVSEDNPKYSSEDGLLLNKEGDTILEFPRKRKGTYTIPEGIICLEDDSFPYNGEITELTLPDSLETVKDVSLPSELKKLTIGASLQEIPEFFVKDRTEVIISEENPYLK